MLKSGEMDEGANRPRSKEYAGISGGQRVERWQRAREISQKESIQRKVTGIHVQPVPARARAGQGKTFSLTLVVSEFVSRMSGGPEEQRVLA